MNRSLRNSQKLKNLKNKEVLTSPSEKNSAWAEKLYILELLSENNSHIAFHKEAFHGEIFIKTLTTSTGKKQNNQRDNF